MAKSKAALSVSLVESPKAAEALTMHQAAQQLQVIDKASHTLCLEHVKGAKALRREMADHYKRIKDPINTARNTVLDMERDDYAKIDPVIALLEGKATTYASEQRRREQEEADRSRRENEAREQARRDEEARKAEEAALALEASSNVLSEREQVFVREVIQWGAANPAAWLKAARIAGYKDPASMADRLVKSEKIQHAITNAQQAAAIRRESEAKQSAPILVEAPQVESQIGKVSGIRTTTTYSCQSFVIKDVLRKLADGYGTDDRVTAAVDAYLLNSTDAEPSPMQKMLNAQARDLKTIFGRVWPAVLGVKTGVAG